MLARLGRHGEALGQSAVDMLLAGVSTPGVGELLERIIRTAGFARAGQPTGHALGQSGAAGGGARVRQAGENLTDLPHVISQLAAARTGSVRADHTQHVAYYGHDVPISDTNASMSANVTSPSPLQSAFSHGHGSCVQFSWPPRASTK